MSSSFERGRKQGGWTSDTLRSGGFHSAQDCLEHAERTYQEHLIEAKALSEPQRQEQIDFLDGMITEARITLRRLMHE